MKYNISIFYFFLFFLNNIYSQDTFVNPIINGGYPDPSIVRVDDDFYIVNSSFEYFPALPIHHSKDLVNWELIGYGIDRPSQASSEVNLVDVQQQGGIHAPSIRYHDGLFYIVVTNVYSPEDKSKPTDMVNFILTAKNPAGPWSDPFIIKGAPGIDPDIFFDDNGKVWFVGTHDTGNPNQNGIGEIWIQELDLENWKLIGQRHSIWKGACGGCCVEGPHIYKQYDRYYLMVAEGGTSYNHAVMIGSSKNIEGPYDSNPKNPILTSRHLSNNNWVHSTGHADLVQLKDNRWYMVALGIRNEMDATSNMGRETHLMPVSWEEAWDNWVEVEKGRWEPDIIKWPVVAPETGKVERNTAIPFFIKKQNIDYSFFDDFDSEKLDLQWNFRRVPKENTYNLNSKNKTLKLNLNPEIFKLRGQYNLMGFRQKETEFDYSANMSFKPKKNHSEAGVSIFSQDDNYINFTVKKENNETMLILTVKPRDNDLKTIKSIPIKYNENIILKILSKNNKYTYHYSIDNGDSFMFFSETAANLVLCKGYIGTNLGLYATSNGNKTKEYAEFNWVKNLIK
ncbi:MAG: glycoside hydrolase family 43 protein [Bacteroidetes bacterium]|jgi:xylan 1,4-beta-xylosidase|nr:glycoside hydrolase family 43 protein [Bacteroidota bacterium]MDA1019113.1 glycoside hydrolase family 43 protein [Bacteroidota bacterium]|tara:strand:+ start:32657 stop:34351 length:1695 start_codon:yes stop_codon:yes gene_type:complete